MFRACCVARASSPMPSRPGLASTSARPRRTASSRSTTSNVSARAPRRRCLSCTEKATGKIRYFEELDSPEKVDEALALIESGKGFETTERWPLGPYRHGGRPDTNILLGRVDKADSHKIETYLADGGYETARVSGHRQQDAARSNRRSQGRQCARAWRRGFPGRPEMVFSPEGRVSALSGSQRRRVGAWAPSKTA